MLPPGRARLATRLAHRIADADHDDGDACSCLLGRLCRRRAEGRDHIDGPANELRRDRRKPVGRALAVAVLVGDVLAFDVAELAQGLAEGLPHGRIVEDADARDFSRLLRRCRKRPHGRGAAQQGNKIAASHSATSE